MEEIFCPPFAFSFSHANLNILQAIVQTLIEALPAIGELTVMLLVVFLVFAVINVTLFGGMCVEGEFCYDVIASRFNCKQNTKICVVLS